MSALLEVRDLVVSYGHVEAVRGVSLTLETGQIVTLIGPNGAGKTSILSALCGLVPPQAGAVLLDEPSMGLSPILVQQVFETIAAIHRAGTTILLVEQNARLALSVADDAYVLERGQVALHGSPAMLADDPRVKAAYLGG